MSSSAAASYSHDGKFIVESLIKYINFEDLNDKYIGLDFMNKQEKEAIILSRINTVLHKAVQTPFYKNKYQGLTMPLQNFKAFEQIDPLTKDEMVSISAHHSDQAFTGKDRDCYIFSAGGTTGLKKYVLYGTEEFSKSKQLFGKGFRALGIGSKNIVANLFPCGAFYTAFLAINKGLEETGCKILSLTGNISHKDMLEYIEMCKPDTIFGLPSLMIPLAQYAEQN
jgi:phenylacetate-coenzyme A ligase PaaK-like adenylate-forming protein